MLEGGGQLSIVLIGRPKLKNDLRRPKMEEVGDRTTVFEFGGLRDPAARLYRLGDEGLAPGGSGAGRRADRRRRDLARRQAEDPLQIGQHLVRAFEAAHEVGAKPVDVDMIEAVLSRRIEDLEPRLTRNGYDLRSLVEQFDAKPAEVHRLLRGELDAGRTVELLEEMRAAGLPT